MIKFSIPGREDIEIKAVVFDYNGTIAVDGKLIEELKPKFEELAKLVDLYVLTADTFGTVADECKGLPLEIKRFPEGAVNPQKAKIVKDLGEGVCAVGNGFNDKEMFKEADLAICVLEKEGICPAVLTDTDILVKNAVDALDMLLEPKKIKATLRY